MAAVAPLARPKMDEKIEALSVDSANREVRIQARRQRIANVAAIEAAGYGANANVPPSSPGEAVASLIPFAS